MTENDDVLNVTLKINSYDPEGLDSLTKAVEEVIRENQQDFHPLFERLIDMGDARITVVDDSLYISDCSISSDRLSGVAFCMFDSDFYAGCKDMNSSGEHEVELPFDVDGDTVVFAIDLPPRWVPDDHMG